jgi:proline iminopeptidase
MRRFLKRNPAWFFVAVSLAFAACDAAKPLPDDGFVDVPGGRVAFRVIGGGDGVPALVIHGGPGGSSCIFPATLTGVGESRPVVMYDQLGSGHSDRMVDLEEDAALSRFVSEVEAIRAELGLQEVHLVGHSWGAAVALEYLLTDPTGVLSASFVGPFFSTDRWLEDATALIEMLPEETQAAIRMAVSTGDFATPEFQAATEVFNAQFFSRGPRDYQKLPECLADPRGRNMRIYEYMWGPSEFVSTGTLRDFSRIDRLPDLNLPTLFLVGEYDEARPATMLEFQALVPGSVVKVIPDAGHLVNVDQPEAFNKTIAEFLASVEER